MDDTFDTIITRKCTINLLSSIYLGDYLFTKDDRGIEVSVTDQTTSEVLFRGYVQPLTFAQDYNSTFNSFTINCDDYLSTLQNRQYKQNNKLQYVSQFLTGNKNDKKLKFSTILELLEKRELYAKLDEYFTYSVKTNIFYDNPNKEMRLTSYDRLLLRLIKN